MDFKTILKRAIFCVPFTLGVAGLIAGGTVAVSGTIIRDKNNLLISPYIYTDEISDLVRNDATKLYEQFTSKKISGDKYLDQLYNNRINAAKEYYAEDGEFQSIVKEYEKGLKFVDGGVIGLFAGLTVAILGTAPMVYNKEIVDKLNKTGKKVESGQTTAVPAEEERKESEQEEKTEEEK